VVSGGYNVWLLGPLISTLARALLIMKSLPVLVLHRMHEMQTVVTDVCDVCLSEVWVKCGAKYQNVGTFL